MKKIFIISSVIIMITTSCREGINTCPSGPYDVHEWQISSYGSDYVIEECSYCGRHRRSYNDSKTPYDYEDMETGDLSIKVPRSAVKK